METIARKRGNLDRLRRDDWLSPSAPESIKVAHWVHEAVRMRVGLAQVDAWEQSRRNGGRAADAGKRAARQLPPALPHSADRIAHGGRVTVGAAHGFTAKVGPRIACFRPERDVDGYTCTPCSR